ncbi:MAG: signal peptidase [Clostridiales bacterium]|nr:signal peptidase [Clostridiales bacterium]
MEQIKQFVEDILEGLCLTRKERSELEEELFGHLLLLVREGERDGLSLEEAQIRAIERFGVAEELREEFKKTLRPFEKCKSFLKRANLPRQIFSYASVFLFAFLISLSFHTFVFAKTEVRQSSMIPTLYEGEYLLENKAAYLFSQPQRGDIVIIDFERQQGIVEQLMENLEDYVQSIPYKKIEDEKRLVKRIIGLPGDTIDIQNGKVFINGSEYSESYTQGNTYPNSIKVPFVVPEGSYFVMGDNREISLDSRDLGFFTGEKIEGKASVRIWPKNVIGFLK